MSSFQAMSEKWNIPAEDTLPSEADAPGILRIPADFDSVRIVKQIENVEYARKDNCSLKLQLLIPTLKNDAEKRPLVLFVRGSAWQKQSVMAGMPQLVELARRGYVIASAEYRPSPVRGFPAQIEDGRDALLFLKEHTSEMCVDLDRVAVWGSSSGAHTVMMMALMERFQTDVKIRSVIDYYGPSDLLIQEDFHGPEDENLVSLMEGPLRENRDKLVEASPVSHIGKDRDLPAFLIMHGDKDLSCAYENSVKLYEKLREAEADVTMYRICGAAHGGTSFWTKEAMDIVDGFLRRTLRWDT